MPKISLAKTKDGNVEIFRDGKRVSTSSADSAESSARRLGGEFVGFAQQPQPFIQSTSALRDEEKKDDTKFQEKQNELTAAREKLEQLRAEQARVAPQDKTEEPAQKKKAEGDAPIDPVKEQKEKDILAANTAAEKEVADISAQFDTASVLLDTSTKQLVESIKKTYEARIGLMKKSNDALLGTTTQSGFRSGRAKFLSATQSGIFSEEESKGQLRVGQLEGQMLSLMADAEQARSKGQRKLLNEKMSVMDKISDNLRKEVKDLQKMALDRQQQIEEAQSKQALSDNVFNAMAGGKTEVADIFQEMRNKGIAVTPKQIEDLLKSFIPKPTKKEDKIKNAFEFSKKDVGQLISVGLTGEDIQATQNIFNKFGLYSSVPELGDRSLAEFLPEKQLTAIKSVLFPKKESKVEKGIESDFSDMAQGLRVARMAFGTGRSLSDKDRDFGVELFNKGQGEGLDVYDIVDQTFGFVIDDNKNKEFAESLRNTVLNFDGKRGMSDYDFEGIARLINNGESLAALIKVENEGADRIREIVGATSVVVESDVDYINGKVIDIEDLLGQGWTDEVGAFGGNISTWLAKKFGFGQATTIKAKITSITADMVNKRAGSAITDTEWEKMIAPNVPAMNDSPEAFANKLEELVGDTLERHNSQRRMVGMPKLNLSHIENPSTKVKLYSGEEEIDPNPNRLTETQAETKIVEVYSQFSSQIDSFINDKPDITNLEILQILGI